MKKVAIVQSNYIPWKGYFDLIAAADTFILYDDMQFTRRDWRNRNLIKTPQGLKWLTVPVVTKGRYTQTIRETMLQPGDWADKHWRALEVNYRRARHFEAVAEWLAPQFQHGFASLSELNRHFLRTIADYLGIETDITDSSRYTLIEGKSERLADLCAQAGGTVYISGPAARDYLNEAVFAERGIAVEWFDYAGYPEYPQLWGPFEHGVTVLDLLFNCGPDAPRSMKFTQAGGE